MKFPHVFAATVFYILMLVCLALAAFEDKEDTARKCLAMLYAIWALMMHLHHHSQWKEAMP